MTKEEKAKLREAAAELAKLAFIVNVVINGEKKVVKAFAGNMESAHRKGCEFLSAASRTGS